MCEFDDGGECGVCAEGVWQRACGETVVVMWCVGNGVMCEFDDGGQCGVCASSLAFRLAFFRLLHDRNRLLCSWLGFKHSFVVLAFSFLFGKCRVARRLRL